MANNQKPVGSPGLIPPHGGYGGLKSFQMSELVYDATVKFCDRFIDPRSRTHDQMVQAARSGNKNIAEGSQVSGTSKKIELKLVNVARASLEEFLGDYKDFLRQRRLTEWGKDTPMSRVVRRLAYAKNRSYKTYSTYVENAPPEVAANTMLCLVHQTNYLLDQQLRALEQAFLSEGGLHGAPLPSPTAHAGGPYPSKPEMIIDLARAENQHDRSVRAFQMGRGRLLGLRRWP